MTIFELHIFGLTLSPTYYGLMYVFAFIASYIIVKKSMKLKGSLMDDLLLYCFFGVILGGRIFYILFYNLDYYINNPIGIIKTWEGGMSFHGGALGVIIAMYLFSKKFNVDYLKLSDQVCRSLPIGLFLGRIGNYLNKELLGFDNYQGLLAIYYKGNSYFPSTLLEAFLEGILLFFILNYFYYANLNNGNYIHRKLRFKNFKLKNGQIGALFLFFYAIFRLFVEAFFREPDIQVGYILGFLTMGEILTLPMLFAGIFLFYKFKNDTN